MESPLYYQDSQVKLYQGHCLVLLKSLPDESVDCCVSSPPYWNLRQYGTAQQVWGGNPDCAHQWATETYYREGGAKGAARENFKPGGQENAEHIKAVRWHSETRCSRCGAWQGELGQERTIQEYIAHLVEVWAHVHRVLKPTGTCWLNIADSYNGSGRGGSDPAHRQHRKTTWSPGLKKKDLCLIPQRLAIALQEFGWYVRSEIIWRKPAPMPESVTDRPTRAHEQVWLLTKSHRYHYDQKAIRETAQDNGHRNRDHGKYTTPTDAVKTPHNGLRDSNWASRGRNSRTVWTINTASFAGSHFAVMPDELALRCILAGCPEGGTVLDPFAGTGTSLAMAKQTGRNAIGIELNTESCEFVVQRCRQQTIFGEISEINQPLTNSGSQLDLLKGA